MPAASPLLDWRNERAHSCMALVVTPDEEARSTANRTRWRLFQSRMPASTRRFCLMQGESASGIGMKRGGSG